MPAKPTHRVFEVIGKALVKLVEEEPEMFRKMIVSLGTLGATGIGYVVNQKMNLWNEAAKSAAESKIHLAHIIESETRFLKAITETRLEEVINKRTNEYEAAVKAEFSQQNNKLRTTLENGMKNQLISVFQELGEIHEKCKGEQVAGEDGKIKIDISEMKSCILSKMLKMATGDQEG